MLNVNLRLVHICGRFAGRLLPQMCLIIRAVAASSREEKCPPPLPILNRKLIKKVFCFQYNAVIIMVVASIRQGGRIIRLRARIYTQTDYQTL